LTRIIETAQVGDALSLAQWLLRITSVPGLSKVMYLEDRDGNAITCAQLVERRLSDGSVVFDVKLSQKKEA
jgi:hypothetical protein